MALKQYAYHEDRERAKQKSSKPIHQNPKQVMQGQPGLRLQRARRAPRSLALEKVLQLQSAKGNRAVGRLLSRVDPSVEPPNRTGLPDNLKAGIERLSGFSMDDVRVHYNSSEPAQLNALAYTQGTEIHVAPAQEHHLQHEAWHVVQQKQGRVKPTFQLKGEKLNDDNGLEHEADMMGAAASRMEQDMVLRQGVFQPTSQGGRELIVYESIHEAQQNQMGVWRGGRRVADVIQRLTIAYTNAHLGYPPPIAPAFEDEIIQQIVYVRAAIPPAVRQAVDGFADCPAAGTYNHHVGHNEMVERIKNLCEGKTRTDIVDELEIRMDLMHYTQAQQRPVNPMSNVAAFNTWLDNAIVLICDWPMNIFRGPQNLGEPHYPTAPSLALTNRLNNARALLQDIDML